MPKKLTTPLFIEKAKEIWGEKYDYSKAIYISGLTPLIITCPEHGDFSIKPQHHLQKSYCPECGKSERKLSMEEFNKTKILSTETWVEQATAIHGDKFDYSQTVYVNAITKLKVVCSLHGEQKMLPQTHLKGYGCSVCGKRMINISNGQGYTQEQFIERASKIGDYSFHKTNYISKREPVIITCNRHGDFTTKGELVLKGHGCPHCFIKSAGETKIAKILILKNIEYITEKRFSDLIDKSRLRFDFYLPLYNACIEFDGEQHFKKVKYFGGEKAFKDLQNKDAMKNLYCETNNIPLLRVRFDDKNVEGTIDSFLSTLQK